MIELRQGDCLQLMKDIPDKSIDMILCDLPYGTTACKWDNMIPFEPLWKQYNRIIKDNGAIVLFGSQPFTSQMICSNFNNYKHHWIWLKNRGTGFQVAKYRPMMKTEDIIVFAKKRNKINYYPQMVKLDKAYYCKNATSSNGTNPLVKFNKGGKLVDKKYPTNVLEFNKVSKPIHPTEKPVALLEYLIKTYTKENEVVLDNCMGSGSSGVACINTNRSFIGIELDQKYFEIAKQRIYNAQYKEKQNERQKTI